MKRIKLNRLALSELKEAARFYENQKNKLGDAFLKKVQKAFDHVRTFPISGTLIESGLRKHIVHRFHHTIIYSDEQDFIYVLSIMHQSRHPNNWKDRIKDIPK